MSNSRIYCRRLARTELLVNFKKSFLSVSSLILLHDSLSKSFIRTENFLDLLISTNTERSQESSKRNLSVFIDSDINHVVRIHFIFKPSASVRDNSCLEQILTGLVLIKSVINTW